MSFGFFEREGGFEPLFFHCVVEKREFLSVTPLLLYDYCLQNHKISVSKFDKVSMCDLVIAPNR